PQHPAGGVPDLDASAAAAGGVGADLDDWSLAHLLQIGAGETERDQAVLVARVRGPAPTTDHGAQRRPVEREYKEPLYAAPPLLQRMVDAGRLGRKTGSGFYAY
ncbi:3-hydroxyacyl-CoA dehydrogenase family protein, partial [Streptomyces sp. NPDC006864]|uniref:3-hydroxyacyl-CoA dehydrogenase family protein n=1 Tax=Streptomyces sp. NPDC006864 TaxID=3154780 RepID=UPI003455E942